MPNIDSQHHVVKTTSQWNERAVEFWVVPRGCLCVELTPEKKTKIKVGEGNKFFSQLPYICSEADLSNYYTKEEIDNIINNFNRMAIMSTNEYDSKNDLPMTGNKLGDVRFVKSSSPSIKIDPDVYLWNGMKWIYVGGGFSEIDLRDYLKKEEFHALFDPVKFQVDEMYPMRHTHTNKDVLDQTTAPYTIPEKEKLAGLENYDDTELRNRMNVVESKAHTHSNKTVLDQVTQQVINNVHNHANKTVLDQTTANYTIEEKEKLASLEPCEGVLDVTQEDPNALNELTIHFRESSKVLTIPSGEGGSYTPGNGIDITNDEISVKLGSGLSFDQNDAIRADQMTGADGTNAGTAGIVPAPTATDNTKFLRGDGTWAVVENGVEYKAGAGISITDGGPIDTDYYFDTQVSCNLSGNRLTKTFTKYNTEPAFGAIVSVYTNESFTGPVFVGRTPDSIKYTDNTGNPQGTVVYRDETWYYSTFDGWVDGERVDTLNNMQKIEGLFNIPAQTEDIVFAILDAAYGSPTVTEKEISVVPATTETIGGVIVGDGLDVNEEGVLSVSDRKTYVAGDGIMINDSTSFELSEDTVTNTEYFFDTQVTSNVSGRTFTKYNTEPALGAIVYASSYSQPFFVGLTADSVKYGTDYNSQIWPNPDHPTFEYKGVTWYYSGFEYSMPGDRIDSSGHMRKLSGSYSVSTEADLQNIARAIIDTADIITNPTKIISTKIGSGLQFDTNGAIEAIPYTLPTASASTLGGVKVGSGLSIDSSTGVLSATGSTYSFREGTITGAFEVQENDGAWQQIAVHSVGTSLSKGNGLTSTEPPDKIYLMSASNTPLSNITIGLLDPIIDSQQQVTGWKVKETYLPSYVDDVVEGYYYNNQFYEDEQHTTVITPESGKIYIDIPNNESYRWGGTTYVMISNPVDVFHGADGTNPGTAGLVPAPLATDNTKFLKGDGTWAAGYTHPTYTPHTLGIYKIAVDSTGHVNTAQNVESTDIENLLGHIVIYCSDDVSDGIQLGTPVDAPVAANKTLSAVKENDLTILEV